jgi:DnaK suppressor protein
MLARRIREERRALLERLGALDRRDSTADRKSLRVDGTRPIEAMEAVQESVAKELELVSRETLLARLRALARAEELMRRGSYGLCGGCGGPIAPARLAALPEAALCLACAEEAERGGLGSGRRGGRRGGFWLPAA